MNNGVNETNNQSVPGATTATTAPAVNNNIIQPSAVPIAATHPQILASSGEAKANIIASLEASGAKPPTISEENTEGKKVKKEKVKKPANKLARLYFVIIILLVVACGFLWYYHQQQMLLMEYKCTPVSTSGEEKELDLNSNIVKDLYSRVKTSLREDLGGTELNDELKLYLAFRQVPNSEFYDSHCKSFTISGMEPFSCDESTGFTPKAFKIDALEVEYKKLFGVDSVVPHGNIQLSNSCIGGYQYIESRGEYVQGQCSSTGTTLYTVEKELTSAYSKESTIVLRERVKYYGSEGLDLSERLVSGTYEYTFKLDMNYNYAYVGKNLVSD